MYVYIVEVKKVKFVLEQAMKAQNETIDIAVLFFNLSARSGWVVVTPRPLYPRERDTVPIV